MKSSLRKCPECGRYTVKEECQTCLCATVTAHPPRYSPEDKYGKYRRTAIQEEYGENGKYDDSKI